MTNISPDKSYRIVLVRSEMSTSAALITAYPSLWSSAVSVHEIQLFCLLHISFVEKIGYLYDTEDILPAKSLFAFISTKRTWDHHDCVYWFADHGQQLQGYICWEQIKESAWVSLSPLASNLRRIGTTHHLSPCIQTRDCRSGEHCQVTTGLGRFRLSFKSYDVLWFKENKTLMTGTLSLPKPKWKHLDWTNGRLWWFTTILLKSMQDIFWDILQLQSQLTRIFECQTISGTLFSCSTRDELCIASTHCAWDMENKKRFFSFSRHDSWF